MTYQALCDIIIKTDHYRQEMRMRINIVTEFEGAEKLTRVWAREEWEIDFFAQPYEAARCTISFAATELENHLRKILTNCVIGVSNLPEPEAFNVYLISKSTSGRGENYSLIPRADGIEISGEGRVGVLYGVYELLKLQGFRWIEPGDVGEYKPDARSTLTIPDSTLEFRTTSAVGRGFSIDGRLNENEELLLWMARNRLNVYFNFPNTCRYMHKLGFIIRDGGHIFEGILAPDAVTQSGKTMFEEHEEWYGLPESGVRSSATALRTQFCVARNDLLDYLSDALLRKINREWREAEEINVWGFDTWGGICTCEGCRKIGNASDQMLYMASYFRRYLNKKRRTGELSRDVRMVLCAYEGSATVVAPKNPIPQNLVEAGDHVLFAPIVRCYEHGFGDAECSYNREYDANLAEWNKVKGDLQMSALEYYNVSKFEDLPLLFLDTMKRDFLHYYERGMRGFSYMHIPMVNWGVRALTHLLYAELSWNVFVDTERVVEEYLGVRYGTHASRMRKVYGEISDASKSVSSWRAWKRKNLLSRLSFWDGGIPDAPLEYDDHFESPEKFALIGGRVVSLWNSALAEVEVIILEEKNKPQETCNAIGTINPIELMRLKNPRALLAHLLDDKRGLIYGRDSYELEYYLALYHEALRTEDTEHAEEYWRSIEECELRLESYYLPATYTVGLISMISKDALTRTQLADVVTRCRAQRIKLGI